GVEPARPAAGWTEPSRLFRDHRDGRRIRPGAGGGPALAAVVGRERRPVEGAGLGRAPLILPVSLPPVGAVLRRDRELPSATGGLGRDPFPAGCDLVALVRVADPPAGRCRPIPRFWPRTDDGILGELSASAQGLRDRLSHLRCAGLPAHVARARAFPDHRLDARTTASPACL